MRKISVIVLLGFISLVILQSFYIIDVHVRRCGSEGCGSIKETCIPFVYHKLKCTGSGNEPCASTCENAQVFEDDVENYLVALIESPDHANMKDIYEAILRSYQQGQKEGKLLLSSCKDDPDYVATVFGYMSLLWEENNQSAIDWLSNEAKTCNLRAAIWNFEQGIKMTVVSK